MKKFFAILLIAMLMLSLAVPAMAANITIDGGASGSEYAAYKLLNATDGGDGKFAYTLNSTYTTILQSVTGKTEQADIVDYISKLDADGIRTFADTVYAKIIDAKIAADYTTSTDTFTGVDQGYYLIAETKLGTADENESSDTFSLVMLDTAGNDDITVTTKEDKPTVEKKVEEVNDSTGDTSWGDSADHDVGDVINYEITGTVSSKYADYESYYYSFSDTMDKGLTYNGDAKVYVVNGDVKTNVTEQFTIVPTTNSETNLANGFTATANLKELTLPEGVTITASTTIVVEYTATLNENAVSGTTGNKNDVVLEYENDPYHKGDGNPETPDKPEEPGETPKDTNIVFTYDVSVDKVDKDSKPLTGAGFTLYKWVEVTPAVEADPNNGIEAADAVYGWVAVGSEVKGDALTTFEFKKLDEGKYKLVESTVPAGYNKAADVEFEIVSTLEGTELKNLTVDPADNFTVTLESGKIETDIVNQSGAELPETGGMGTTIFYIVGGIMVVGAVVLLVTKKRMGAEG